MLGHLEVEHPSKYHKGGGHTNHIREPKEVGYFSLDGNRSFLDDLSEMKFLKIPKPKCGLKWDLNIAYEDAIRKDQSLNERLDNLLTWIVKHSDRFATPAEKPGDKLQSLHTDFICWRGSLATIMSTPYERQEPWMFAVTPYRQTAYICQFETPYAKQRRAEETERQKRMCAWGYKFEQYMVADSPSENPTDPTIPVNEKSEFCAIFRSRLDRFSLVYGAEMDGLLHHFDNKSEETANKTGKGSTAEGESGKKSEIRRRRYSELKTSRQFDTERQYLSFCRFKLLKWWCQSYLANIPSVWCGFRTDEGIVHTVEEFPVAEMPTLAQGFWKPTVCLEFLKSFLKFVHKSIEGLPDLSVVMFEFDPECRRISAKRIDLQNEPDYFILPEWYTTRLNDLFLPV